MILEVMLSFVVNKVLCNWEDQHAEGNAKTHLLKLHHGHIFPLNAKALTCKQKFYLNTVSLKVSQNITANQILY